MPQSLRPGTSDTYTVARAAVLAGPGIRVLRSSSPSATPRSCTTCRTRSPPGICASSGSSSGWNSVAESAKSAYIDRPPSGRISYGSRWLSFAARIDTTSDRTTDSAAL